MARSKELPQHWNQAVLRCLDSDPSRRFASAGDFVAALQRSENSQASAAEISDPVKPKHRSTWFRRLALGTGLVAAVFGVLSAALSLTLRPAAVNVEVFDIENQTGTPDYEYLSQGITAEVMRRLS